MAGPLQVKRELCEIIKKLIARDGRISVKSTAAALSVQSGFTEGKVRELFGNLQNAGEIVIIEDEATGVKQ